MKTIIEKLSEENIDSQVIKRAADIIKRGGLVAFPTETVYGLGANALNAQAAAKIYSAKGRPSDNPLIAHIADRKMLEELVTEIPPVANVLMDRFWPGPMTLIFNKSDKVPDGTTGGLSTVAVRFPDNKIAQELIRKAGVSIAAPSANLSGKPSPTLGKHVVDDMDGRIDMIIDGGMVGMGLESTIIDVTAEPPMILRPGFITKEMLSEAIGQVEIDKALLEKPGEDFKPKAPGMKYRHYAPNADYTIYKGGAENVAEKIILVANEMAKKDSKVGVITSDQNLYRYKGKLKENIKIVSLGDLDKPETIAVNLFKVLRDFDDEQCQYIYGEAYSEDNVGAAIMNRLTKAAGYNIINV